jgi:hypothetical protein
VKVFNVLYNSLIRKVSKDRVITFENSKDIILRSGFINLVAKHFKLYFKQLTKTGASTLEIYR